MALFGLVINKKNPEFTKFDFIFWMPQFKNFIETDEGNTYFNKIYTLANRKVFYSIFGSDWELAMSYVIAHYLTLIANQLSVPSGDTLEGIAGGGTIKGVLSSASVGSFSKSYDIDKTVSSDNEAKFWNQTSYGASYWALKQSKPIPSIFVVTPNPAGKCIKSPFEEKNNE